MKQLCTYGCGQEGRHQFKNGKYCCSTNQSSCPVKKDNLKGNNYGANKSGYVSWNKGLSKETDERLKTCGDKVKEFFRNNGHNWQGKKHSERAKEKISTSMLGNYNAKHRGDRQSYYKGIRMDSSWEVKVAQYLDSQSIIWEYGSTVLPIEGSTYRPDFKLANGTYIEVKGYWREANKLKFSKVLKTYPELIIEVWDKIKLKQLGLL